MFSITVCFFSLYEKEYGKHAKRIKRKCPIKIINFCDISNTTRMTFLSIFSLFFFCTLYKSISFSLVSVGKKLKRTPKMVELLFMRWMDGWKKLVDTPSITCNTSFFPKIKNNTRDKEKITKQPTKFVSRQFIKKFESRHNSERVYLVV